MLDWRRGKRKVQEDNRAATWFKERKWWQWWRKYLDELWLCAVYCTGQEGKKNVTSMMLSSPPVIASLLPISKSKLAETLFLIKKKIQTMQKHSVCHWMLLFFRLWWPLSITAATRRCIRFLWQRTSSSGPDFMLFGNMLRFLYLLKMNYVVVATVYFLLPFTTWLWLSAYSGLLKRWQNMFVNGRKMLRILIS